MSFVDEPVDGIAILLWAADPEAPHRLATPFFHAAAAAALDIPVEIYFTARSVQLLAPGVAAALRASERHSKTVLEAMRELDANLGGEQSGHVILSDYATTGDGLIAGLQMLGAIVQSGKNTSDVAHVFEALPQLLENVRFASAPPLDDAKV